MAEELWKELVSKERSKAVPAGYMNSWEAGVENREHSTIGYFRVFGFAPLPSSIASGSLAKTS